MGKSRKSARVSENNMMAAPGMMFPNMPGNGMNPMASMMNPFMFQQQQQLQQMQQQQQAMAAGGGESRQSANESSSSSEEDEEVKRIRKANKKSRARQAATMQIDRLASSTADPDNIPRSSTLLRGVPLAACLSTSYPSSQLMTPEPFPQQAKHD